MRAVISLPDSGSVQPGQAAPLLYSLHQRGVSGCLWLKCDQQEYRVYWRRGNPVSVWQLQPSDSLGRILLEQGIIDMADYNQSLMIMSQTKKKHGQVLMEMGKLSAEQLQKALETQIRRKLNRLFFLPLATYELASGEDQLRGLDEVRVPFLPVLFNGLKNAMDEPLAMRELGSLQSQVKANDDFDACVFSLPLSPDEKKCAEGLRQWIKLEDLAAQTNLAKTELLILINYLELLGLVDVQRAAGGTGELPKSVQPAVAAKPITQPQRPITGSAAAAKRPTTQPQPGITSSPRTAGTGSWRRPITEPLRQTTSATTPTTPLGRIIRKDETVEPEGLMSICHQLPEIDYYVLLGVRKTSEEAEIKANYFLLARVFHPDRFRQQSPGVRRSADEVFGWINRAFNTLVNQTARKTYDEELKKKMANMPSADALGRAKVVFDKGLELLTQEKYGAAEKNFAEAAQITPHSSRYRAYHGLALTYCVAKEGADPQMLKLAEKTLTEAVRLNVNSPDAHAFLARTCGLLSQWERAVAHYERALTLSPDRKEWEEQLETARRKLVQREALSTGPGGDKQGLLDRLFGR